MTALPADSPSPAHRHIGSTYETGRPGRLMCRRSSRATVFYVCFFLKMGSNKRLFNFRNLAECLQNVKIRINYIILSHYRFQGIVKILNNKFLHHDRCPSLLNYSRKCNQVIGTLTLALDSFIRFISIKTLLLQYRFILWGGILRTYWKYKDIEFQGPTGPLF